VQWAYDVPVLHGPHHCDGNIRILMVSPNRQPLIPDVPKPAAGLAKPIVDKLSTVMAVALADTAIAKCLNENGLPAQLGEQDARAMRYRSCRVRNCKT
jgi:hypothetical protein